MNNSGKIRLAKKNDLDKVKRIWEYCFNDTEEYIKFYFEQIYKPENSIVFEFDNKVVASLNLNQYKLNLNKTEERVSYIVGVSTLPEIRGLGIMKKMMGASFNEMSKKNQNFSILMPIDVELYRKYGYEICYDILIQKVNIEELRGFKADGFLKKAEIEDAKILSEIYNNYIKNKKINGAVKREKKYFETMLLEVKAEGLNLYLNDDKGYILYSIEDEKFIVRELYYKNIIALKTMLKFIYNHNTQCKEVVFHVDIRFLINEILKKPQNLDVKIEPFMMGRIINVEKAIKNKRNIDLKNITDNQVLIIKIIDNYVDCNNGVFKIMKKERNKVEIKKIQNDINLNVDLTLSINQLTQLMFSYRDLEELAFIDESIEIQRLDEGKLIFFNELFKKEYNHINEYV